MARDEMIAVIEDTLQLCKDNQVIKDSVNKSIVRQQLILEGDVVKCNHGNKDTRIVVSKDRSFEAASKYAGKKVCVLNFASATNPGGGVLHGSTAQEECLCRISTLYPCINELNDRFHYVHRKMLHNGKMNTLYNNDCIYTPDVLVFKSDTRVPKIMSEDKWFKVDVITCAAPNLRNYGSLSEDKLEKIHLERCNRILDIACSHGSEVIILGAFGCGAFGNDPRIVAQGMKQAVVSHYGDFDIVEFAIYCSPWDQENYEVFKNV